MEKGIRYHNESRLWKAYNLVSWDFVYYMLKRLGFMGNGLGG